MILEQNPSCHAIPACLCSEHIGEDGLWDPEKWHQSFSTSSFGSRLDGPLDTLRESDDSSYVVLGPQRRSFQGGCHVAEKEKCEKTSSNYERFSHAGSKTNRPGFRTSDYHS